MLVLIYRDRPLHGAVCWQNGSGCGICVDACPVGCIAFGNPDAKTKTAYPELINLHGCLSCGFCVGECPVDAIVMAPPPENQSEAA